MVVIFNAERSGAHHTKNHSENICFQNKKRIRKIVSGVFTSTRYRKNRPSPPAILTQKRPYPSRMIPDIHLRLHWPFFLV